MAKAITSKTESLTIRVPIDLMAEMRAEAKATNVSVGSVFVGRVRAADTLAAEIAALKNVAQPIPRLGQTPLVDAIRARDTEQPINPSVSHPSGPILSDPRPQNIQGQATGYRPKGTWKDGQGKK